MKTYDIIFHGFCSIRNWVCGSRCPLRRDQAIPNHLRPKLTDEITEPNPQIGQWICSESWNEAWMCQQAQMLQRLQSQSKERKGRLSTTWPKVLRFTVSRSWSSLGASEHSGQSLSSLIRFDEGLSIPCSQTPRWHILHLWWSERSWDSAEGFSRPSVTQRVRDTAPTSGNHSGELSAQQILC